jgi:hypothetical protein
MSNESINTILDQAELTIDTLMAQLMMIRNDVTKLRKSMAGVSTQALDNGTGNVLSDEQIAKLLNRRDKVRAKRHS